MTEEKYLELVNAGVDQFSFSLDFPDERHDDFRRRPGLYAHLEKLIPKLTSFGYDNIILNTAITSKNFRHMIDLTKKAEEWNTYISFSAYTLKRTWNEAYAFTNEDDLNALEKAINELIEYKRKGGHIATAESTIRKTLEYFKRGGHMPNCRAGSRFVIVLPNGSLLPCTYFREKEFSEHKQILKEFTANNKCDDCFVSVRAFSDKSVCDLLFSSIDSYRAILAKHKDSRRNK
jgi:MoaA/NifB/PqqE/SkfB family radical SAM enzyme